MSHLRHQFVKVGHRLVHVDLMSPITLLDMRAAQLPACRSDRIQVTPLKDASASV